MAIEETAFEERKDFTQLLTDAAMKPESSHAGVATQKFAVALSKEWVTNAYNDVVAQNRMKIPNEIEINVDTFNGKTSDGQNETELIESFNALVDREKEEALASAVLSGFDTFCLWGSGALGFIGLLIMFTTSIFLGLIAVVAAVALKIKHYDRKQQVEKIRKDIEKQFEQKRTLGT